MKKEADVREKYTANSVIDGGYKIYDKWKNKKYSSRKIVRTVYLTASLRDTDKAKGAQVEALSYLFALDLRIKERYKTMLRLIVFFFAWRRETKALKWLRKQLNLSAYSGDIRSLIEIELERIRKILELEELDGKDNRKKGGRTPAVSEDKDLHTDASQNEADLKVTENKKIQDNKLRKREDDESSLESEYEIHSKEDKKSEEQVIPSKQTKELSASPRVEKTVIDKEPLFYAVNKNQEKTNVKKENNGIENESEPNTDKESKNQEIDGYVDVFPFFTEENHKKTEKKVSFIDEIIMDHLAMGVYDITDNTNVNKENLVQGDIAQQDNQNIADKQINGGKDNKGYLYDEMRMGMKNAIASQEIRESIRVDISPIDKENDIRNAITESFSKKDVIIFKEAGTADLRHRMDVYCEEHGKGANDKSGKADDHNAQNAPPPKNNSGIKK